MKSVQEIKRTLEELKGKYKVKKLVYSALMSEASRRGKVIWTFWLSSKKMQS